MFIKFIIKKNPNKKQVEKVEKIHEFFKEK